LFLHAGIVDGPPRAGKPLDPLWPLW